MSSDVAARRALDLLSTPIAYWDREEHCVFANTASRDRLGVLAEGLTELTLAAYLGRTVYRAAQPLLERVRAGETRLFERSIDDGRGATMDALVTFTPDVVDGVVQGFTTWIVDRRAWREQDALLNSALQQAQRMESVGRLAGGVAHDFNNMLGIILGRTEMALRRVDAASPTRDDLIEIQRAAERSTDLTRRLLTFARQEVVTPQVVDADAVIGRMMTPLRQVVGARIAVDWLSRAALWPVRIDPTQLEQILFNLCTNARDAIEGTGTITIQTANVTVGDTHPAAEVGAQPGDYVQIGVRDSGRGMERELLPHIFEPFFTTRPLGEGTGLGLSMVYGAVRQNGGVVTVESTPGSGSIFTIYLPREGAADAPTARVIDDAEPRGGSETILLVEDEPGILRLTSRVLHGHGYTVLRAATPSDALMHAAAHEGPIHLLLSDVVMPETNGRDLARRIVDLRPQTRILFMSGYPADIVGSHGILEPGVQFLAKPFGIDALLAKVRQVLDGA
jgi:signal transduction histidine kinase/ActR/RegA family two-component response regulator